MSNRIELNQEKIEDKIEIFERNLKLLTKFQFLDPEEFVNDYLRLQGAKYPLLEIIEPCEDVWIL